MGRRVFWFSGTKQSGLSELDGLLAEGAKVSHFGVTGDGVLVIVAGVEKQNI